MNNFALFSFNIWMVGKIWPMVRKVWAMLSKLWRMVSKLQPTLLKSIRFCFIDVRWLLTAFDFQILKTTTCTLSYKTLKILSTFCSLVWKIRENLKILFSKIWPDRTDSCNIMCIWVKSPGEFKNLDLSKVNEHRTSSSLLESLKLSCTK